jgi:hypothetical protein
VSNDQLPSSLADEIFYELTTYGGSRRINCPLTGTLIYPEKDLEFTSSMCQNSNGTYCKAFGHYYFLCEDNGEEYVLVSNELGKPVLNLYK